MSRFGDLGGRPNFPHSHAYGEDLFFMLAVPCEAFSIIHYMYI
jgi:hypothetical protein